MKIKIGFEVRYKIVFDLTIKIKKILTDVSGTLLKTFIWSIFMNIIVFNLLKIEIIDFFNG